MKSSATTIEQYFNELPIERQEPTRRLYEVIKNNLPQGFESQMQYGMIGFVVPFTIYPEGYFCDPKEPFPFISLASQKNSINLYHMAIYSDDSLKSWFLTEYAKTGLKLDMGKSCIRFKKFDQIPYDLIAKLVSKVSIDTYLAKVKEIVKSRKK